MRKVLRRVTTDQADVRGVRPYRPGDPIRGIHWRSSARRGELMVREYDAAPSPELVLVVEPWLPDNPTAGTRANLEAALSLAVTIARTWSRASNTRSPSRRRRRGLGPDGQGHRCRIYAKHSCHWPT